MGQYPSHIRKAVFPVAGLGTRFLPATKALPKEMLPIVDKPLIQYAVDEAYAVGIRQMIFVTGRNKRSIEDHFDMAYELEMELERTQKKDLLVCVEEIKPHDMQCFYVRQSRALGLGHAVYCARDLVGEEAFALLLADDFMQGDTLQEMVAHFKKYNSSIIAVEHVSKEYVSRYGIIAGKKQKDGLIDIDQLVEKPHPDSAPSNLGIIGRYILTPAIFDVLGKVKAKEKKEIQITDSLATLLQSERILGYPLHGTRYDCGSKIGYLKAVTDTALQHAEIGQKYSTWLKTKKT